jgi:hypothetical protein
MKKMKKMKNFSLFQILDVLFLYQCGATDAANSRLKVKRDNTLITPTVIIKIPLLTNLTVRST